MPSAAASSTPVDVVWSLITTADGINRWMSVEADVDLTVGGELRWVPEHGWVVADFTGSGLVVKLPKERVAELIEEGVGQPFAPAGKVSKAWVAVPERDRRRWRSLLREGVAFVAPA